VTVVRPGDVYGPGSRPWTLLPLEAIRARQFVLPAMGRGIFSPFYVDDLADGIVLAATRAEAAGHVFTLSGGVGVPCREFFGHYHRMLGRRGPIGAPTPVAVALAAGATTLATLRGTETELRPSAARYLARRGTYSIAKARRMLRYEPRIGLDEGMARTEAWLRAEGLLGAGV
jgi:nucleoside-diphosphate-sugar epimerase